MVGGCDEVATHRWGPFEVSPQETHKLSSFAVSGFLLVFGTIPPYHHKSGWLYCLATRAWSDLPRLPKSFSTCADGHDLMCEIKWSATPVSVHLFIFSPYSMIISQKFGDCLRGNWLNIYS